MGRRKRKGSVEDVILEDFTYNCVDGKLFRKGREVKTVSVHGYIVSMVQGKFLYGHRISWFLHYGTWPSDVIDHINRVKTDNRISNLRDVKPSVNVRNSGLRSDNTSGYKNVSWDNARGVWCLRKWAGGKYKFLGYFNCPTAAFLHLQKFEGKTDIHT